MPMRDPEVWMWGQACELMDEAERLRQQFFTPGRSRRVSWEPPADVLESEDQLWIIVALPGVPAEQVVTTIEGGTLIVSGQRPMPKIASRAQIRRLELPHGHFERRLELAPGRYEIGHRELADGCLVLGLKKLG